MEPTTIAAVGVGLVALLASARRADEPIVAPAPQAPPVIVTMTAENVQRQAQVFGGLDPSRVASAIETQTVKQALSRAIQAAIARIPTPTPAQREAATRFAEYIATGTVGPVGGVRPIFGRPRMVQRAWEGLDPRTRSGPQLRIFGGPNILLDRQTVAIASWYLAIVENKPLDFAATYAPNAPNVIAAQLVGQDVRQVRRTLGAALSAVGMRLNLDELGSLDVAAALKLSAGVLTIGCSIAAVVLGILTLGTAAGVVAAACSAASAALGGAGSAARGDVEGTIQAGRDLASSTGDALIQSGRTI